MMDSTTAGFLLAAAKPSNVEEVSSLYKSLNKESGGPSQEAIDFFEKNKGKQCKVKLTSHVGLVHDLNSSTSGIYPGSRYPIYVEITSDTAKGSVFEYDFKDLEIIE